MTFAPIDCFFTSQEESYIPILFLEKTAYKEWLGTLSSFQQQWLQSTSFIYEEGKTTLIPTEKGTIDQVVWMGNPKTDFWQLAKIVKILPLGVYKIHESACMLTENLWCLAWILGHYQFDQYKNIKKTEKQYARLWWPSQCQQRWVKACAQAIFMVRDLINEPACTLTPFELAQKAQEIATFHEAHLTILEGETLKDEYPCVYTVGKGAENQPYFVDLKWSHEAPKKSLVLVGKGVCFDSGGLDLKPANGMVLMKKDMGGAAHVLGLAHMIMSLNLPVSLRVLLPAVENSISGSAMRPLDIIITRKKTTVEVGNTDAEGRLILCDALYEGAQGQPDLLVDFATLTGAARIALGTEIAGFFCNDHDLAHKFVKAGEEVQDPVWQLPLYHPYAKTLQGTVADLNNIGKSSYGGAITAALFLEHFVTPKCPWIHVDMMAWNLSSTPGRPEGGEAMGLRAMWHLIEEWLET